MTHRVELLQADRERALFIQVLHKHCCISRGNMTPAVPCSFVIHKVQHCEEIYKLTRVNSNSGNCLSNRIWGAMLHLTTLKTVNTPLAPKTSV